MEFKTLKKKDYKKAIQYAVVGMHFNWYMNNPSLLKLYGRYFLYMELNRATQVIAAYEGDELAGVLLAEMYGEKPCCKSIGKQIYAGVFHWLQHIFVKGGVDCYDKANENMRNEYLQNHTPDGELIFLAANPRIKRKGTGSLLCLYFPPLQFFMQPHCHKRRDDSRKYIRRRLCIKNAIQPHNPRKQ